MGGRRLEFRHESVRFDAGADLEIHGAIPVTNRHVNGGPYRVAHAIVLRVADNANYFVVRTRRTSKVKIFPEWIVEVKELPDQGFVHHYLGWNLLAACSC